ncbi:MAG: hypothetical protein AMXMBFR77_12180 [Phycisphaerales bacterium]|nr:hypothetical protein [Phycisphaeraceae bacterium]MCW5753288.1 hypothetical protein [Phycisphaeraceae bacterium]
MANERIDTSISMSVTPEMIDVHRDGFILGANTDGSPVFHDAFTKARATMEAVFTKSRALSEAERALKAATAQQADPAQERRLRTLAARTLGECRKAVEGALESIGAHRAKADEEITNALGIPAARLQVTDSQRASDVRAALRAMGKAERMAALRSAVQDGDAEAVGAILSASPLAAGLSRTEADNLRADAERRFTPELAAFRSNLDRLREVIVRAGDVTEKRFGSLVGRGNSPAARVEAALSALESN